MLPLPLAHQGRQNVVLFPVRLGLLRGQRHVENPVRPRRQVLKNFLPRTPQQDRRQLIVNAVEPAVADQAAVFVDAPVLVEEAESRTETAAVDELDH